MRRSPNDAINSAGDEYAPSLSPDEQEIWFARGIDLFHATRAKTSDPFGTAIPVPINTAADEADPFISADLLTLLFIREPSTNASWDIFMSTRASTATDFGTAKLLAGGVTGSQEILPFVTADGKNLYYASDQGGGSMDIWTATSDRLRLRGCEEGARAELVVGRDRCGADGGSARRVRRVGPPRRRGEGSDRRLPGVARERVGRVTWISPDRCRVCVDSKRPGGPGGSDIYVAER